jgi:hypothetical protein
MSWVRAVTRYDWQPSDRSVPTMPTPCTLEIAAHSTSVVPLLVLRSRRSSRTTLLMWVRPERNQICVCTPAFTCWRLKPNVKDDSMISHRVLASSVCSRPRTAYIFCAQKSSVPYDTQPCSQSSSVLFGGGWAGCCCWVGVRGGGTLPHCYALGWLSSVTTKKTFVSW